MPILYVSGGRYYSIKKRNNNGETFGEVSRISCAEYDNAKTNPSLGKVMPKVGDNVIIIIKPYHHYECKKGIVKDVLTKSFTHSHGHKVRIIHNNKPLVGRVVKIL